MKLTNVQRRQRRHNRLKKRLADKTDQPRLLVFRSLKYNYAKLIDAKSGNVIVQASDLALKTKGTKTQRAKEVGGLLGKAAIDKGIKTCIFDRNGFKYHGRVKAIAEGAREAGLQF